MVVSLLRLFVDITLWRRGPQDVPASTAFTQLVLLLYLVVDVLQVMVNDWPWPDALLVIVFDVALQSLWLWALLWYFNRQPRFMQTLSAFLGVGALLTLVGVLIDAVLQKLGSAGVVSFWQLLQFAVVLMSLGRILQQAMERSLFMGMALTWVIMLTIAATMRGVLPTI